MPVPPKLLSERKVDLLCPKNVTNPPWASRYASAFMLHLFSPDMRFETWRRLWVALARAEHNLGLARHRGAGGGAGGPHHRHRL